MKLSEQQQSKQQSILSQARQVSEQGPFQPNWESLKQFQVPEWYERAKFGIFIHWGLFAVPAFHNEWYSRNMYQEGTPEWKHHAETFGPHTDFGYKDFIPMFKAEKFNADQWADLFVKSGARYVIPVAEHHDGFQMYGSELSEWNAVQMGPRKDIIAELGAAARARGLKFGVSSHRAEHWWFFDGGRKFPSDVQDPAFESFYGPAAPGPEDHHDPALAPPDAAYLDDWLARTCELADKYEPDIVYFDWWIQQHAFEPYLQQFASYYYNLGAERKQPVAINYKYKSFPEGTAIYDVERGQLKGIREPFWQTDTAVSYNSWCYVKEQHYKPVEDIVSDLVDIVSKNGSLLLNIGPKADGTLPDEEIAMLETIGEWLSLNGEAIYDSKHWTIYGEGPTAVPDGAFSDGKRDKFTHKDIRFTVQDHVLYAITLRNPGAEDIVIESLGEAAGLFKQDIARIDRLGWDGDVQWERGQDALTIRGVETEGVLPVVFRITPA
ncbi:alpha-L-fucosidase [Paenibacillus cellulosilyticus]|uniref:alpha-L-fucosidase n=1 Tax=Paenibacillus cellulosilyticus TaxID=375489 RepID=A0A2V2YZ44_9BACL|nr:alpha-L-fucosidase [Paenibacillus cellulosilyticus]PWW07528.1 alpha-L-fucosidase [Paenibacillus cellulosilyticus]QKS44318.1 alpha-L-fucosidase [Paenibacillus cellulosilyticus]